MALNKGLVIFVMFLFLFISLTSPLMTGGSDVREDVFPSYAIKKLNSMSPSDENGIIVQFQNEIKDRDMLVLSSLQFDVLYAYHVIHSVYAKGTLDSILTLS